MCNDVQVQVKIVHTLGSFGRSFGSGMVCTVSCILNTFLLPYLLSLSYLLDAEEEEGDDELGRDGGPVIPRLSKLPPQREGQQHLVKVRFRVRIRGSLLQNAVG